MSHLAFAVATLKKRVRALNDQLAATQRELDATRAKLAAYESPRAWAPKPKPAAEE